MKKRKVIIHGINSNGTVPITIGNVNNKDWYYYISRYQKLSEDFIKKYYNRLNWARISQYQTLSESFIREFKNQVCWNRISRYQKLSEDFIREFADKVDWYFISVYQKISESFIREFKDKVNWTGISTNQKLSESFIREFKDKVDWYCIPVYQILSEEFKKEFKEAIKTEPIETVVSVNKINTNDIHVESGSTSAPGDYEHVQGNSVAKKVQYLNILANNIDADNVPEEIASDLDFKEEPYHDFNFFDIENVFTEIIKICQMEDLDYAILKGIDFRIAYSIFLEKHDPIIRSISNYDKMVSALKNIHFLASIAIPEVAKRAKKVWKII